jgi:hypothetical protein
VDYLRRHAAEGRLTTDELTDRVGRALLATTLGELDDLVRDLPPEPLAPPTTWTAPPRARWRSSSTVRTVRIALAGLLLLSFAAPDGRHSALFLVWLLMLGVLRLTGGRARRARREALATVPDTVDTAPRTLGEWHPPGLGDMTSGDASGQDDTV